MIVVVVYNFEEDQVGSCRDSRASNETGEALERICGSVDSME